LFATPSYGTGLIGRTANDLIASPVLRKLLPAAGTAAALNYGAQE